MAKRNPLGVHYIINNEKLPDHVRNHEIFRSMSKIKKIFPYIGLPNTKETFAYENKANVRESARAVLFYITGQLYNYAHPYGGLPPINKEVLVEWNNLYQILAGNDSVQDEGEKIVLRLVEDCKLGGLNFKKGEGIFKVYAKIREQHPGLTAIEQHYSFKNFSSLNIPNKNYFLVFSSDGPEGIWDIATMSERGITSCQSWTAPQSKGLIGSISSQYVGVIYLTNGEEIPGRGTKMCRRAVVRYALHKKTKKPVLLVDRIYPAEDDAIVKAFEGFLASKTKLPVIFTLQQNISEYYLPKENQYKSVEFLPDELTYMDTKMEYAQKLKVDNCLTRDTAFNVLCTLQELIIRKVSEAAAPYLTNGYVRYCLPGFPNMVDLQRFGFGNPLKLLTTKGYPLYEHFSSKKEYIRAIIRFVYKSQDFFLEFIAYQVKQYSYQIQVGADPSDARTAFNKLVFKTCLKTMFDFQKGLYKA